jgi:hypothetical protein
MLDLGHIIRIKISIFSYYKRIKLFSNFLNFYPEINVKKIQIICYKKFGRGEATGSLFAPPRGVGILERGVNRKKQNPNPFLTSIFFSYIFLKINLKKIIILSYNAN